MATLYYESSFAHHGIKGQKWGIRRYQNKDGTLTSKGKKHYLKSDGTIKGLASWEIDRDVRKMLNSKSDIFKETNDSWNDIVKAEQPMLNFLNSKESKKYASDDKIEDMFADIVDGIPQYDKGPYKDYAIDNNIDYRKLQKQFDDSCERFSQAQINFVNNTIKEYRGIKVDSIKSGSELWKPLLDPINQEIRVSAMNYDRYRDRKR